MSARILCTSPGCKGSVAQGGLCWPHYMAKRRGRDPMKPINRRRKPAKRCIMKRCRNDQYSRQLCRRHYIIARVRRKLHSATIQARLERAEEGKCERPGCDEPPLADALCPAHFVEWMVETGKRKDNIAPGARASQCVVKGCKNKPQARNLCQRHWQEDQARR